ncbi:MAG: hypothetical protein ACTFAL_04480 [Candidatus Electronema sp. V4]
MSAYLLDTHSFLWSAFEPEKLSRAVHAELASSAQPAPVHNETTQLDQ